MDKALFAVTIFRQISNVASETPNCSLAKARNLDRDKLQCLAVSNIEALTRSESKSSIAAESRGSILNSGERSISLTIFPISLSSQSFLNGNISVSYTHLTLPTKA